MDIKTRNLLTNALAAATEHFLKDASFVVSAEELAAQLNVSRSVISKYLNEMAKENRAIKIVTRPVLFLDKGIVEKRTGKVILQDEFISVREFLKAISNHGKDGMALENVIGAKGSLCDIICELKSCANYPSENGRAILLLGEPGTGKKHLCYAYASYLKSLGKNDSVTVVQCAKGTQNSESIFGNGTENGLLMNAGSGILYFNDAASLPRKIQEDLALLMENDYIWKKNGQSMRCRARFLFANDISSKDNFSEYLKKVIPVHAALPPLHERPIREKELLIQSTLMKEQTKLDCVMQISSVVYNILLRYDFCGNVDGLQDVITSICARANVERKEQTVQIVARHLPPDMFAGIKDANYGERGMLTLQELRDASEKDSVIDSYNTILKSYKEFRNNPDVVSKDRFFDTAARGMNQCCDHIIFEKKPDAARMDAIRTVIQNVFAAVQDKVNISAQFRFVEVLTALIYKKMYLDSNIQTWEEKNEKELADMLEYVRKELEEEYETASSRINLIRQILDVGSCSLDLLFSAINLKFYRSNPYRKKTLGLILAHGYATASSIADSVNRMLDTYIFDAVDMPLDVSPAEIAEHVTSYIKYHNSSDNLVLLVDMGSLESVTEKIGTDANLQIGIMNNVSTRSALEAGSRIMACESLEEILSHACINNENKYRIITYNRLQDAIIVTTEAGDAATERVIRLFEKSLPKKIDVKFVAANNRQIWAEGTDGLFLKNYHPLFIVCTMDTGVKDIPQLLLEDIIGIEDIGYLRKLFGNYFDYGELRQFAENLLKNFTLENVIENITILNPNVLLSFIERAVDSLEIDLKMCIPAKTRITLYIHTCCMVERVITGTMQDESGEITEFAERSRHFITSFQNCFSEIEEHYHINIPVSEMKIVYDYLHCDRKEAR